MPASEWMKYAHGSIGGIASMMAALALAQLKPLRKPVATCALLAAMCALRLGAAAYAWTAAVWPALWLICAAAIHFLYRATPCYSALTTLLAGLFFGTHQTVCWALPGEGVLLWLLDGAALLAAGLCCYTSAALLPDADSLPVANDRTQRWKMRISFFGVGISLAAADLWLLLAPEALGYLPDRLRGTFTLLTAAGCALLLWYVRRLTFSVLERAEALMDKQYQGELLSFMQDIRSQRHDFNFHLRAISTLIGHHNYQECDEYIQQIVKNSSALNDMLPLHNAATSALISAFQELALQKGIKFDVAVTTDMAQLPCTVYEINTIIGNLLQNAIDELEQTRSSGPIRLSIMFRSRYYVIRVTNPCSKDPETMKSIFQPGYSTKRSHEGLGLATVRRITERYGGKVLPEFGQGLIHMVVQLPFSV